MPGAQRQRRMRPDDIIIVFRKFYKPSNENPLRDLCRACYNIGKCGKGKNAHGAWIGPRFGRNSPHCEGLRKAALSRAHLRQRKTRIDERGAQTAAGIFAAKEAVVKALGTGFRGFGPAAIEVRVDALGKPLCALSGKALERMQALGGETIHLSITHTGDMAAAVAILEGN